VTATLAGLVRQGADRLRERLSHEQNPALDAEVLARHVLGWDRARWVADSRDAPPAGFAPAFSSAIDRRARGEPIAYITGTREFWGLDFEVTPAVLIPRPETETLVEQAPKLIDARGAGPVRVADVGTGSGCVAVALAHSRPSVTVAATDISDEALDVARRNAVRHGVADRVTFRCARVLDGVGPVDLVVSNPPYIGHQDEASVMKDVLDFEPHRALFSGNDGLDVIRELLAGVRGRTPVPPLLFEFGGAEAPIRAAVEASGLTLVEVTRDLAGLPRVARVGV
jgi:release factor glutamine methyltransferase